MAIIKKTISNVGNDVRNQKLNMGAGAATVGKQFGSSSKSTVKSYWMINNSNSRYIREQWKKAGSQASICMPMLVTVAKGGNNRISVKG